MCHIALVRARIVSLWPAQFEVVAVASSRRSGVPARDPATDLQLKKSCALLSITKAGAVLPWAWTQLGAVLEAQGSSHDASVAFAEATAVHGKATCGHVPFKQMY